MRIAAASCGLVGGYVAHPHAHYDEGEDLGKTVSGSLARDKFYRADHPERQPEDSDNCQDPTRFGHAEQCLGDDHARIYSRV